MVRVNYHDFEEKKKNVSITKMFFSFLDADQKGLMDAMLESLKSGSAFGNRQNSRRKRKNRKEEKTEEDDAVSSQFCPLCFTLFLFQTLRSNFSLSLSLSLSRCECL
jgi:hypothetical protein